MFDAYSFSLNKVINISSVDNLNEIFGCIDKNCSARFIAKSIAGTVAPHFCRLKSYPHSDGCLYELESSKYHHTNIVDKYCLEDILSYDSVTKSNTNRNSSDNKAQTRSPANVHTPQQLLKFCISNSLDTIYRDNMTVGDIIIDSRNLKTNAMFRGVTGIRFVLGHTCSYDKISKSITFTVSAPTKKGTEVKLTLIVSFDDLEFFEGITNYYNDKFHNKFKGHNIAVLGYWDNTSPFTMQTKISKKKQVVFHI